MGNTNRESNKSSIDATIIIPFIVNPCVSDKFLSKVKKSGGIGSASWKRIDNVTEDLFGGEDNYLSEKSYFYSEFFDTFYDPTKCGTYIYMCQNKDFELKKSGIKGQRVDRLDVVQTRQFYVMLTRTGSAVLTIELKEDWLNISAKRSDGLFQTGWNWINRQSAKDILESVLGESDQIFLPFGDKKYKAVFELNPDLKKEEWEKKRYGIRLAVNQDETGERLVDFFAHYLMIYTCCILQKTEIIRVSEVAGQLTKDGNRRMMEPSLDKFISFLNLYDFPECTPDEEGHKFYKEMRTCLELDEQTTKIKDQIEMLSAIQQGKEEKQENNLLTILSLLAIFSVLQDGQDFIKILFEDGKDRQAFDFRVDLVIIGISGSILVIKLLFPWFKTRIIPNLKILVNKIKNAKLRKK